MKACLKVCLQTDLQTVFKFYSDLKFYFFMFKVRKYLRLNVGLLFKYQLFPLLFLEPLDSISLLSLFLLFSLLNSPRKPHEI